MISIKELNDCLEEIVVENSQTVLEQELFDNTVEFAKILCELMNVEEQTNFLIFGSFKNGFGTKDSDIDVSLTTNSFEDERNSLEKIETQLKQQSRFQISQSILQARIPVLKLKDTQTNVYIDLCWNNILGAINTQLLKAYSSLDPKVQQGGKLLKIWAKGANVINNFNFSTYSIILLWLHYLQQKHSLPNLQNKIYKSKYTSTKLRIKRNIQGKISDFTVDTFFLYEGEKYEEIKKTFSLYLMNIQLLDLLKGFFHFYSKSGEGFNSNYKISINGQRIEKKKFYSMIDPFDSEHDPLLKVNNSFNRGQAFDNALQFLNNVKDIKMLFSI